MDLWDCPLTQSAAALCVFRPKTENWDSFFFCCCSFFFIFYYLTEISNVSLKNVLCSWWHTVSCQLCIDERLLLRDRQAGKLFQCSISEFTDSILYFTCSAFTLEWRERFQVWLTLNALKNIGMWIVLFGCCVCRTENRLNSSISKCIHTKCKS